MAEDELGIVAIGGLTVLFGATVYVGTSRYGEQLDQFRGTTVDFTTPPTFVYSLVQALGIGTLFAVLLFLTISTGLVESGAPGTSTPMLVFFGGVIPGVVLGAGYPLLIQRQAVGSRLTNARISFGVDNALTISAYILLLALYEPVSALLYAFAYVVSRLAILVAVYGGSRLQAAIV